MPFTIAVHQQIQMALVQVLSFCILKHYNILDKFKDSSCLPHPSTKIVLLIPCFDHIILLSSFLHFYCTSMSSNMNKNKQGYISSQPNPMPSIKSNRNKLINNNNNNNRCMETCYLENYQIWMSHVGNFNLSRSTWTHIFSPSYDHITEATVHIFWRNFLSLFIKGLHLMPLLKLNNTSFHDSVH